MEYRTEKDTMGEVRVPKDALYRAQTQRAVENFPISGTPLEKEHIIALARIKKAAATANSTLGHLDKEIAKAIQSSADEDHRGQPPRALPGRCLPDRIWNKFEYEHERSARNSGNSKACSEVHPNDHVNMSQSSNDVFPTSVSRSGHQRPCNDLLPALDYLAKALEEKAAKWAEAVKPGRTHLMDATPVTFGQEFAGYAAQIRYGIERVNAALPRVSEVPQGGTPRAPASTPSGFPKR